MRKILHMTQAQSVLVLKLLLERERELNRRYSTHEGIAAKKAAEELFPVRALIAELTE